MQDRVAVSFYWMLTHRAACQSVSVSNNRMMTCRYPWQQSCRKLLRTRPSRQTQLCIITPEGVDFIPANIELSGIDVSLVNTMSREHVLKTHVNELRKHYDYILIDCMPSLGMMPINALVAADSVIIPSQPNFLSTKGLNLLMRSIARVKRQINPNLKIDGILLTMVDNRTNNAKSIISSLRATVGQNLRVFNSEIPYSVRAAECSNEGKSIFAHDKNGKVAQSYDALAQEVIQIERSEKHRSRTDRVR